MKMKKTITMLCGLLIVISVSAQDLSPEEEMDARIGSLENSVRLLQKFKVSGYIQTQFQYGQSQEDGTYFKLTRANAYESSATIPGITPAEYKGFDDFYRLGVRRGRIKFTYTDGLAEGVLQLDMTDGGVGFKDAYLQVRDPWFQTNILRVGVFDRPFGHEIAYSSSRRESPERFRIFQRLFPGERDLGAMLILQPSRSSPLNIFKLDAGLFAGNGSQTTSAFRQYDSHMDFIGRLSFNKPLGTSAVLSGGVSGYFGGVRQSDSLVYVIKDSRFVVNSHSRNNIGKFAKRQYIGFDLQFSTITAAGLTQLRGEYIFGEHPQNAAGGFGFTASSYPAISGPTYMRKLNGGYVILTQDFGATPFTAVVKYDWYNPNIDVSGDDIAKPLTAAEISDKKVMANGTGNHGDITRTNIGLGLIWRISPALRLTAYYDIASNETTEHLKNTYSKDASGNDIKSEIRSYGYEGVRPANCFTMRLQFRF